MSLLSAARAIAASSVSGPPFVTGTGGAPALPSSRPMNSADILRLYRSSRWVRLALDIVGDRQGTAEWFVALPADQGTSRKLRSISDPEERANFERRAAASGDLKEVDHPLSRWMNTGNAAPAPYWIDGPTIAGLESKYLRTLGEAFYWIERADVEIGGKRLGFIPARLWPLPPTWISIDRYRSRPFTVTIDGRPHDLGDEDLLYLRNPDLPNPYGRGAGKVESLGTDIEVDENYGQAMASMLENRGRPDLAIVLVGAGEREREMFEKEWRRQLRGPTKIGQTKVMTTPASSQTARSGVVFHDLQKSFADLEASETRGQVSRFLLECLGVAPDMVGMTESSNRATAYVAERSLRQNSVIPGLEARRRAYQSRFLDRGEYLGETRLILSYRMRELVDQEGALELMTASPQSFTDAEKKTAVGMRPLPGDENRRWVPSKVQLVGADVKPGNLTTAQ